METPNPGDREPLRILVVEDDGLVALDIEQQLNHEGHLCVGIAADAAEAMAIAQSVKLDLALVDLNLRDGLSGPEIAHVLINVHHVPVLFVTASWQALQGFEGSLGVLCKPFTAETLSNAIKYAVGHVTEGRTEVALPHGMIKMGSSPSGA